MARNTEEIYNSIIAAKADFPELEGLTPVVDDAQTMLTDLSTNSNVSDWRIWTYIYSYAQSLLESFFDLFKIELKEIAATLHYGTLPWWRKAAKDFQLGHDLVWDATLNRFKYAVDDADARIIKRSSSGTQPDTQEVVVKVAKADGDPLTVLELAAFEAYCELIAPAGINTTVISQVADDLLLEIEVYYDPLVMAADGSLLSDAAVFPVELAILNHISSVEFDGEFVKTKFQDELQLAVGVVNPMIRNVYSRIGIASFVEIGDKKQAYSGQFRIDPLTPLSDQITYTANV